MKLLVVLAFLAAAVHAEVTTARSTTPHATAVPTKPTTEKPPSQPHKSSLSEDGGDSKEGSSEEYRQLEPDEVKALLLKVIDEYVDKDKDGFVTVDELKEWLKVLQEKVIQDNVDRQWAYYSPQTEEALSWQSYYPDRKQVITWEQYKNLTYPDDALKDLKEDSDEVKEVKSMIKRAERRWKNADVDGDDLLSKAEFRDYIHPEESQRAGGVVVLEAMEDMDADKNNEVSLEEYMEHLKKVAGPEKEDPNWATAQQSHFQTYLDKDKDGSLNEAEMKEWVVPSYDRSEAEAWRLISIADADQDNKISRDDISTYHEYFLTLLPPEYWVQEDPTESSKHDEF